MSTDTTPIVLAERCPLVVDSMTGLCRKVTDEDIRRFELIEKKYAHLLRTLRDAINDG